MAGIGSESLHPHPCINSASLPPKSKSTFLVSPEDSYTFDKLRTRTYISPYFSSLFFSRTACLLEDRFPARYLGGGRRGNYEEKQEKGEGGDQMVAVVVLSGETLLCTREEIGI